ncbi:hypothetical protein A8950_1965 [Dongia mobilis]|uniref:4-amino-4-deoxy-L-arabinose transferase-like glycosyltransferase n=1 Tax=Dongia mobilis TaxID=578943 RepID=A0A4R6WMN4_9PROT|nr:hypothetical protein [Dongia mobilis]TDQ82143.1 hypothetical protein A8950_1965 [Dongia mobilis]
MTNREPPASALPSTAIVLLAAAAGYLLQSFTYLNHDVSWFLWGAREILHGAQVGRDIIEPNPPLAWYLSLPPAWVAERTGWALEIVFRLYVLLVATLALICMHWRLSRHPAIATPATRLLLVTIASLWLFILCGRDFGQREHLATALLLPYVVGTAIRFGNNDRGGVVEPVAACLLIGLMAGIGVTIKPYFFLIPLLLEGAILLRWRRLQTLFRIETWAILAVAAVYFTHLMIWDRGYIDVGMALALPVYWGFNLPFGDYAPRILFQATALAAILFLHFRGVRSPLSSMLGAASLGFLVALLLQQKGYTYHAYPASAFATLAVAALFMTSRASRLASNVLFALLLLLLVLGGTATAFWWRNFNTVTGSDGRLFTRLIDAIDARPDGYLAISTHPTPGFPMALYAKTRWTSRTNSQWFLPAVVALREGRVPMDASLLAFAEEKARSFILHDLAGKPGIVVLDAGQRRHAIEASNFDILAFYNEDPAFREIWRNYREAEPIGRFRIFLRAPEPASPAN